MRQLSLGLVHAGYRSSRAMRAAPDYEMPIWESPDHRDDGPATATRELASTRPGARRRPRAAVRHRGCGSTWACRPPTTRGISIRRSSVPSNFGDARGDLFRSSFRISQQGSGGTSSGPGELRLLARASRASPGREIGGTIRFMHCAAAQPRDLAPPLGVHACKGASRSRAGLVIEGRCLSFG